MSLRLEDYSVYPLGDSAVVIKFGDHIDPLIHALVMNLLDRLMLHKFTGIVECVSAFTTITVLYDPLLTEYQQVADWLMALTKNLTDDREHSTLIVRIPVCYGGEFGPDLENVAISHGLSSEEVISLHSKPEYLVYMIGFVPGFPYLGGLVDELTTPRLSNPRMSVQAGSVGIAGRQTGVYPVETPGGWQIIGRTPLFLFRPWEHPPSLLSAGDKVQFYPVDREAYDVLFKQEQMKKNKGGSGAIV